jgi:hypothetical protein
LVPVWLPVGAHAFQNPGFHEPAPQGSSLLDPYSISQATRYSLEGLLSEGEGFGSPVFGSRSEQVTKHVQGKLAVRIAEGSLLRLIEGQAGYSPRTTEPRTLARFGFAAT